MKRKIVCLLAALSTSAPMFAQTANEEFLAVTRTTAPLLNEAYTTRDTASYRTLFTDMLAAYNKLGQKDKTKYQNEINSAWYNMACTYALAGNKKKALYSLEQSKYYDYAHLLQDTDLDILSNEPRFMRFVQQAKAHSPNYLSILRSSPAYSMNERKELPPFTYQSMDHPKLEKLLTKYELASISGGSDVAQIINLMRWVHEKIKHDGSKGNPETKNALSMLNTCIKDGTTLNCRGMAIVLNEVYLALGIPSRIVTCLPKDPNDNDCHVIVSAWSASLRKWLWMDPTFMAYVMDEKGTPLGIQEVRDRLIQGRPLAINPDANHNKYEIQTREDYLYRYMAKNLYKLECPAESRYNYETPAKGKERTYIQLLGGTSNWQHSTSMRKDGMNTYHTYFTANPRTFWQVPPGQSRAEQDKAVGDFINNCNNLNDDAINASYSHTWDKMMALSNRKMWPAGTAADIMEQYGKILSYKYLGVDERGVSLYKLVCRKSTHAFGFTLDGEGKFGTFRFQTTSPQIRELMIMKG